MDDPQNYGKAGNLKGSTRADFRCVAALCAARGIALPSRQAPTPAHTHTGARDLSLPARPSLNPKSRKAATVRASAVVTPASGLWNPVLLG